MAKSLAENHENGPKVETGAGYWKIGIATKGSLIPVFGICNSSAETCVVMVAGILTYDRAMGAG